MSNKLIWKILKARLKLWIKKQFKRVGKAIMWVLRPIGRFLVKKRYIGNYPKLREFILKSSRIVAVIYIVSVPVFFQNVNSKEIATGALVDTKEKIIEVWEDFWIEKIVIESVGTMVEAKSETAVQDTISGMEEQQASLEVAPSAVEEIVDIVHRLESSGGKNNFSKCEAIGKYNEFGYGVYGANYLCFEKGKDREAVVAWFEKEMKNKTLEQSLCKYNTGQATDSCPYVDRFKFLNS